MDEQKLNFREIMEIVNVCKQFKIEGEFVKAKILTAGNINATYKVTFSKNGKNEQYVVQKINKNVFKKPEQVMENIIGISNHIIKKLENRNEESERSVLHYLSTKDNVSYYVDETGEYWRCYKFISNSTTYDLTTDLFVIEEAGKAFGQFQKLLADFDASTLYESIPNFHNTKKRFVDFEDSVKLDVAERASECEAEIKYLLGQKEFASSLCVDLENGLLPLRVTHNDTKCNNVLFDEKTGEALAVIDLDTVMPGLVCYDYGDAIRSIASTCAEDEENLDLVNIDLNKLKAFTKGFVSKVGKSITQNEVESLSVGIIVITLELASRFLKDYLDGDTYFKVTKTKHNLIRAKCQIALAKKFQENFETIKKIIAENL